MKKSLLVLVVLGTTGIMSTVAMADTYEHRVSIGVAKTQMEIKEASVESEAELGFAISYEGLKKLDDKRGVSVGLDYYTVNTDHQETDGSDTLFFNTKSTWLGIPVLYHYNVQPKLEFFGGGYLAFAMDRTLEVEGVSYNGDDMLKDLDYGLILGLFYHLSPRVFVKTQYNLGLNNLNDVDNLSSEIAINQLRFSIGLNLK